MTTLYTVETREVIGSGIRMPVTGISLLLENLIALRYVEHRSRLRRLMSVVKVRDSAFDPNLREFSITDRGVSLAGTFANAEGGAERVRAHPRRRRFLPIGGDMTTILVVDDEPLIAMALKAALDDENYRVITAANGKQGLERLAEARADIVLFDMMMPVMNGPAMLKAIATDPELRDIPVIVLSSLPQATIRAQAEAAVQILHKPYTAEQVLNAIARVLDQAEQIEG